MPAKYTSIPIVHMIALAGLAVAILTVCSMLTASLEYDLDTANDKNLPALTSLQNTENEADISQEFILPNSNTKYYAQEELRSLSSWGLYIALNEIYARHGRGFVSEDLVNHFATCSWYHQLYSPEDYDAMPSQLNEFEESNSAIMVDIRRERGE